MTVNTDQKQLSEELKLRRVIEDFYLPQQLVEAIVEAGGIYTKSNETLIAIGFLDISRYTFLSQFLSPPENQTVLNGLYSAFNWVLRKHGGYLNKIEGDSLMFHYGGPIDPLVKDMDEDEAVKFMARELFYTCVELQRVSSLFNSTNKNYLKKISNRSTVDAILEAYRILGELRQGYASASFNALFQIRIRVGASLGKVLIGNFGPEGAKQWDVIGMPVIEAKRMESSAPIGGLRITSDFFKILDENGITAEYHKRIQREAQALGSVYKEIAFEELFQKAVVYLKDKKNAEFETYSIQVNPSLPESIRDQSKLLLSRGETGADDIVNFIKYYRGNHFVINQLEVLFDSMNIHIRKDSLYRIMLPDRYKSMLMKLDGDILILRKQIAGDHKLFGLLELLGKLQDSVKGRTSPELDKELDKEEGFSGYDHWMADMRATVQRSYDMNKGITHQAYYFYNVIFPMFFANIKAAILEYQYQIEQVEDLEEE
ncbi:MAG: adenylate/guanylate cyclase domain-containing protein [Spirochaetaceae bacterium]|nr:adenylate/guanylate cyclase domain-containing protein [Spirochaetaceae bacterium]